MEEQNARPVQADPNEPVDSRVENQEPAPAEEPVQPAPEPIDEEFEQDNFENEGQAEAQEFTTTQAVEDDVEPVDEANDLLLVGGIILIVVAVVVVAVMLIKRKK